jgi:tRNA(Ile)-lysidine synthase
VSGGGDSVALLHILCALKDRLGLNRIVVAHVNHGLRGAESDGDEAFVRKLALSLGCRIFVKRLSGLSMTSAGLEETARAERYEFILSLMRKHSCRFAATGHTADDQAETVLMRIMRGAGLAGLCGIRSIREDGIIRPLLVFKRAAIREWLDDNGYTYREDSSNADIRFTRNRVRGMLMPVLEQTWPNAAEHLCGIAAGSEKILQHIAPQINNWISRNVLCNNGTEIKILKSGLSEKGLITSEAIASVFRKNGISFDRSHLEAFLVNSERISGEFLLLGGWRYYPDSVQVVISVKPIKSAFLQKFTRTLKVSGNTRCVRQNCLFRAKMYDRSGLKIKFDTENATVFLDADKTGKELIYRQVCNDEKFWPIGAARPVNALRYIKSHKNRNINGVVAVKGGDIVWVPFAGVGHDFRITPKTGKILKVSVEHVHSKEVVEPDK